MRPANLDPALCVELARRHGTPLHLYDAGTVRARIAELGCFERVRYAQKANPGLALLRLVRSAGAEVDAVSAGEIRRALAAGFTPRELRYTADACEEEALALVRAHGLGVTAGSSDMLEQLARLPLEGELWLRANPGFGHGHGRKVATGGEHSKHGIWHEELQSTLARARSLGLAVRGLHLHLGSGSDLEHLAEAPAAMARLAPLVGAELASLSAGGGLPIPYRPGEARFDLAAYAALWERTRRALEGELGRGLRLEIEPGRYVVAEAGVLLTRVLGTKRSGALEWVLVDAGFNDLLRPSFYGAYHHVEALDAARGAPAPRVVAGPLCESGDVLTVAPDGSPQARLLPPLARGDLLCIHDTGAYGSAMASNYNARPLAAEVLVDGREARAVRARQDFEGMVADELRALGRAWRVPDPERRG